MQFKVVVPFYNVEATIEKTIASIQTQKESEFECILIDDGSSDQSVSIAQANIQNDSRFHLIQQPVNKGSALANIVDGFNFIHPDQDSICIMIDGDDWLIDQYGAWGAAVATIVAYGVAGSLVLWCFTQTRNIALMMTKAMLLPLRWRQLLVKL